MFVHTLTLGSAMLIKEVDTNGDWVLAAYSYTDSSGEDQTEPFTKYELFYNSDLEDHFFERKGESYYLGDFYSAFNISYSE